jgi:hypothetical protein
MTMLQGALIVIDANALISYQVLACAVFGIFRKGVPLLVFHFSTFVLQIIWRWFECVGVSITRTEVPLASFVKNQWYAKRACQTRFTPPAIYR